MNIGYELLDTTEKGEGIFATKQFYANDIVMVGIIEEYDVGKNYSHASQMGEFRYALHGGKITKVNHSCSPNCGINVNKTGAHDFVAMQTIAIGNEITFDYAMRNFNIEHFPDMCRCGTQNCRGNITGWKDLPDSYKLQYKGFVAPYLIEMGLNKNESARIMMKNKTLNKLEGNLVCNQMLESKDESIEQMKAEAKQMKAEAVSIRKILYENTK